MGKSLRKLEYKTVFKFKNYEEGELDDQMPRRGGGVEVKSIVRLLPL